MAGIKSRRHDIFMPCDFTTGDFTTGDLEGNDLGSGRQRVRMFKATTCDLEGTDM
jgi:hypothetical protein